MIQQVQGNNQYLGSPVQPHQDHRELGLSCPRRRQKSTHKPTLAQLWESFVIQDGVVRERCVFLCGEGETVVGGGEGDGR